jgi:hypothetical protein
MNVRLTDNLVHELKYSGLSDTDEDDYGDGKPYYYKNPNCTISSILEKYRFKKIEGVKMIKPELRKAYGDKEFFSVEFYINEEMNAVFQFIDRRLNSNICILKDIKMFNEYINNPENNISINEMNIN